MICRCIKRKRNPGLSNRVGVHQPIGFDFSPRRFNSFFAWHVGHDMFKVGESSQVYIHGIQRALNNFIEWRQKLSVRPFDHQATCFVTKIHRNDVRFFKDCGGELLICGQAQRMQDDGYALFANSKLTGDVVQGKAVLEHPCNFGVARRLRILHGKVRRSIPISRGRNKP